MAKMRTSIAGILTFMNFASLTSVLAIISTTFESKDDFIYIIIVTSASYFFIFLLLSSFCLTENECCKAFCPAEKCCICFEDKRRSETDDKKEKKCCKECCDIMCECFIINTGLCIRRIGKHGVRYCAIICLLLAQIGIIILCFEIIINKDNIKTGDIVSIVIVCSIAIITDIIGLVAPCLKCCKNLKYESKSNNKDVKKDKKENNEPMLSEYKTKTDDSVNLDISNNNSDFLVHENNKNDINEEVNDKNDKIDNKDNNNEINKNNNFHNVFGV